MFKHLSFALALALPATAAAQSGSYPKPPDVPIYTDPGPITYAAGTDENCIGSQVLSGGVCTGPKDGGPMPVESQVPTLISTEDLPGTFVAADFITTTAAANEDTDPNYGSTLTIGNEMKFRFQSSPCKVAYDDPVRDYSEPGQAHAHLFWGACNTSGFSTYATARTGGLTSSNSGGPNNGSSYWSTAPIMANAFGDGRDYVPIPAQLAIYYKRDKVDVGRVRPLPQGFRGVFGWDMDVGDQRMIDAVAAANAQPGTEGRYQYFNTVSQQPWGYDAAMSCSRADGTQQTGHTFADLNACAPGDGTDAKALVLTVVSGHCIDGRNLWSPGGYKHWLPGVRDTVKNKLVCPQGWWESFEIESKLLYYKHEGSGSGPRNVNNWRYSCFGQGALPPAGRTCFHQDVLLAWDKATYDIVMLNAFDAQAVGGAGLKGHEMNGARISATQVLRNDSGTPSRRQPITAPVVYDTSIPAQSTLLPPKANSNHYNHGVGHAAKTVRLTRDNNTIIAEGDSITANADSHAARYGTLRTQFSMDYSGGTDLNVTTNPGAIGGSTLQHLVSRKAAVIAAAPKVVTVLIGANGFAGANGTGGVSQFLTDYQTYATDLRAAGIKVLLGTVLPNGSQPAQFETDRGTVNSAIRSSVGTWSDGYFDFAATSIGDEASDALNLTYYDAAGTHPTAAGYDILSPVYRNALDMILRQSL